MTLETGNLKKAISVLRRARELSLAEDVQEAIRDAQDLLKSVGTLRVDHAHAVAVCVAFLDACFETAAGIQLPSQAMPQLADIQTKVSEMHELLQGRMLGEKNTDGVGRFQFDNNNQQPLQNRGYSSFQETDEDIDYYEGSSAPSSAGESPSEQSLSANSDTSARRSNVVDPCLELVAYPQPGNVSELIGLEDAKKTLTQMVIIPKMLPASVLVFPRHVPCSALLHGPPGTGKTTLAQFLAANQQLSLIYVSPSTIFSKWTGDSEAKLRQLFRLQAQSSPCLLFFDEVDALLASAEGPSPDETGVSRLRAEFLILMTQFKTASKQCREKGSNLVLAATNRIDRLDRAVLRRFDRKIHVGKPTPEVRHEILLHHLQAVDHTLSTKDIDSIVSNSHFWSAADLLELISEAAMRPVKDMIAAMEPLDSTQTQALAASSASQQRTPTGADCEPKIAAEAGITSSGAAKDIEGPEAAASSCSPGVDKAGETILRAITMNDFDAAFRHLGIDGENNEGK